MTAPRLAIVTGGGSGIGRAIVETLAASNWRVAFCGRTAAPIEALARALGPGHLGCGNVDLARTEDALRFCDRVHAELGVPDLLVHNAGTLVRSRLEDLAEVDWDQMLAVNLKAIYLVTRAFLAEMRERRSGRIVCISSISGRRGTALSVAYCAAKHGVVGLVRALAEEVRADGIQVNAVCPGSVETAMLPAEFAPGMDPREVARTVRWLAEEAPPSLTGACIDQFG